MADKLRVLESMAKSTGNSVIQWAADEIARLTAERDAAILERRAANEEVEDWSRRCGRILDERDEARARVAELEAAPAASGAAVGACNTFCGERECERTDPTQCKRGEPQPARGGLTAEEREASTEAMKCMTKLRRERDAARAECERLRAAGDAMAEALTWDQSCDYDAATTRGAIRQRVAAWSEARACVAELERDRRPATWQEEEAAVEGAWLLCGLEPDWPSDEPGTIVRHAESMRREVGRLRARVAELEGAAAPAANAGGEPQPPRGWLTKEDCEALYLANAVLHGVFVGSWREKHDAAKRLEAIRVRALSEAGGEVE